MKPQEIRIPLMKQTHFCCGDLTLALALSALLVFSAARAGAQTNITLGPGQTALIDGTYDTPMSNQVTEQGSLTQSGSAFSYSFTNTTGTSLQFTPENFAWFSKQNSGNVVTPYVVVVQNANLQAAKSQLVVSTGDTQTNAASGLQTAAYISGTGNGSGTTFNVFPGQEVAIGFIDALPDGTAGLGPVVPFLTAPAGTTWYNGATALGTYANPPSAPATLIGGTSGANNRAYQFDISFSYVGADQGAWTGLGSATLDGTTKNYALNAPSKALSQGSLTDVQSDANISGILFGDAYFVSGSSVAVAHTNLTVAAGGISPTLPIIFTNNAVNYTINSSDANGISGATSISLVGSGMVTLTGANAYTGSTTISAGTLQLGSGASGHDGVLSTSSIVDNSVLAYNVFGSVAPTYPISGTGALVKAGNGVLTLTSTNAAYAGSTTVSGGTLQLGDGTGGNDAVLNTSGIVNNGALVYNVDASQAAGYPISGSGGLSKVGTGTLTLSGNNTYSGNTLVGAGTLETPTSASLPGYGTTGKVTIAGGAVLDLQTGNGAWSSAQISSLLANASFANNTSGLNIDTTSGNFTLGANITQTLALTKLGANTLTLTGANTYAGGTTVAAGALAAANAASLPGYGTPNKVTVASGAGLVVQTGNGTTGWSSAQIDSLRTNAAWTDNTATLGIDTSNGSFSYGSGITQALSLTKLGPNTLTLTAANTYTGLTTVSGGTLQLGDGTAGHDGSVAGNIVNNSALAYNLSGNQVYSGQITGNGSLVKTGNGMLTLNNGSSYSGPTVITAGTLRLQPQPGIPAGAVLAYTFADGATATDSSGNGNNGTLINSPTFVQGPGGPSSWAVSLDGSSQSISAPYSSSLSNHNAWTASAWVNLTSVASKENGMIGTRFGGDTTYDMKIDTLNPAGTAFTTVHTDMGSGNGWLNTGADANPANPFNPGQWYMVTETVSSGGYSIYVDGSLVTGGTGPVGSTPLFMKSGQTLGIGQDYPGEYFNGSMADVYVYGRTLTSNEVTTLYNSVNAPQLSAVNALPVSTPVTIGANAKLDLNGYNQQLASLSDYAPGAGGSVINSNAGVTPVLTLSPAGGSTTFSGSIQGAISLVMNGNGTQVLAGSNSYTGGTTVSGGTLEASTAASLPFYSTAGSVNVTGGVLAVQPGGANGWSSTQIGNLVTNVNWNKGAGALGIDTSNGNFSYGTSITQPLSLTKLGANTLTLTGSNTYSGLTTVSGGTLQLGDGTPGHDGSIAGNFINNTALVYNLSGNQTYAGQINGSGSMTKTGNGTLTLSGANNYSGSTVITGGTLKMQPNPFIPGGAVAAYTFADGATATDVSGNGNDGTLINSPTFVQGPGGPSSWAVSLDGTSQSISVPYSQSLHLNAWTASAWVNLSPTAASQTNGIIGTRFNGDLTYDMKINNNNASVHSDIGPGEVGWINTAANATPAQPFNSGTWYMVTETISNGGYNIYVDGTPVSGGSGTFTAAQLAGGPPLFMKGGQTLGIGQDYPGEYLSGSLADVYVYPRTLSQTEITALYNSVAQPNLASNALPGNTPVVIAANANLDLNGYNQQLASLSDYTPGTGGNVINGNSASEAVLTLSATGGSTTFSGGIQGLINLVMSGNGTQVLAGSVSGAASVTVNSGALFLSGKNGYTGGTTVNGGLLEAVVPAALPSSGTVTVTGGVLAVQTGGANGWTSAQIDSLRSSVTWSSSAGALGIDTSNGSFTYGSSIPSSQNWGLTKLGPNTLTLTGANSYPGATTISGGTLQLGDGTAGHDGSVAGDIANNSALVYNLFGGQTYTGAISGNGSVTKVGAGVLNLGGVNSYAGPTVINGGVLKLQRPVITVPGGAVAHYTFDDGTASDVTGNGNDGTLINSPGFVMGVSGSAINFTGGSSNPTGVTVPESPSLAVHAYTVSFWENVPSYAGANPTMFSTRTNGDTTFDIQLTNAGGLHGDIGNGSGGWLTTSANANVVLGTNTWNMVTYSANSSGYSIYVNGKLVANGSYSGTPLLMQASSELTLGEQSNSYGMTGSMDDVYVYGSALSQSQIQSLYYSIVSASVLPSTSTVTIAAGSTLDMNGVGELVASLSDFAPGSGGNVINSNSNTQLPTILTLSPTGGSTTFSGSIQGAIGLAMNGTGVQVLAGTNTYTQGTLISNGAIDFLSQAALPRSSSGTVSVAGGATLGVGVGSAPNYFTATDLDNLFSTSGTAEQHVTMAPTSIVGIDTTAGNFTYASNIPASGKGLTKFGANTLTLTGSNLYTGLTTVSGGSLQLGDGTAGHDGVALTNNIVNNAALVYNLNGSQTYNGVINGSGSVIKTGIGTLNLTNPQGYAGGTTISGGTLRLVPGPVAPAVQNASFESPNVGTNNYQYTAPTSWTSTGNASGNGGAIVNGASAWGYANPYPNGNQAFSLQETTDLSQSLYLQQGSYTITWWQASRGGQNNPYYFQLNGANVGAEISTTNTAWTTVSETFAVPAAGNYTIGFLGTSTVDQSVALDKINLIGLSGNLPSTTALTIAANSTLDLDGLSQQVVGSLSDYAPGSGGNIINSNAGLASVLTVSPTGGSTTFSGTIKGGTGLGAISLVLDGPGTLVLAGSNTYTGATSVDLGTLVATTGTALPGGTSLTVGAGGTFVFDPAYPSGGVAVSAGAAAVPEPGTLALLVAGAIVAFATWRRKRS